MDQDGPGVFAQGGAVLLVSTSQRWLDGSHKAAAEGESALVRPSLTAYSPAVWCSGVTEEEGQPLPIVVHMVWFD